MDKIKNAWNELIQKYSSFEMHQIFANYDQFKIQVDTHGLKQILKDVNYLFNE